MAIPTAQELNQKVTFSVATGARNATTGVAETLTEAVTLWARITDLGGDIEQTDQSEHASRQRYEIWTRASDSILPFHQITWGSKTLIMTVPPQIVIDGNNRRWMVMQAEYVLEE